MAAPPPSATISAHHHRYVAMDRALATCRGAVRSHWFAAAACVTHPWRGLGTLDGPLGRLVFTPAQARFLRFVHQGLFMHNLAWFAQLCHGAVPPEFGGLAGRALDHAMVDAEQRRFSELAHGYFRHDLGAARRLMNGLSDRLRHSTLLRSRLVANALHEALRRTRQTTAIDIASEAHRCRIGHQLVDAIRRERGVDAA
ncbi:MAG TPA: hypothetical protein VIP05_30125 [Burkholderiaceae bacterium]